MCAFIAFIIGFWAGIAVICAIHMEKPNPCNQNCNQGRECNCAQTRQKFESET